jgi:hypothetical protein
MTFDDCRPEVKAFAVLMEEKLRENDHKGGWTGGACSVQYLLKRLIEEVAEVVGTFRAKVPRGLHNWNPNLELALHHLDLAEGQLAQIGEFTEFHNGGKRRVGGEAADVANFTMMLADVCGALPSTPPGTPRGSR